jgi:hypothetical protein
MKLAADVKVCEDLCDHSGVECALFFFDHQKPMCGMIGNKGQIP